ncbi:MAG: ABC transporter substrate-binding protein [Myxococcales bacterium]|nr:ABC transporter substrate-binding protein [Myxococcales bacterium]MCB9650482.1 ABC transporter substrate-binding protein [Deltaproteobacteria bacterium]
MLLERMPCTADSQCASAFGAGATCLASGFCSDDATGGMVVDGVSAAMVRTVGIADISGSLRDLGEGMTDGVQAAFAAYNRAHPEGRQFVHEVRDDAYDPQQSAQLVQEVTGSVDASGRHAFAIVGSMGSPTSSAMLPTIIERRVPFFGTYSGATHLRREVPDEMVWNTRASYRLEGETITRHLLHRSPHALPAGNIFAFSQAPLTITTDGEADVAVRAADNVNTSALDPYGYSGYLGIVDALTEAGLSEEMIPLASYRATSTKTDVAQAYFFRWVAGLEARVGSPELLGEDLRVGIAMVPVASAATTFVQGIIDGARQLRMGMPPPQLSAAEWAAVDPVRKAHLRTLRVDLASISPAGDQLATNLKAASATNAYCPGTGGLDQVLVSQVVPFPNGGSGGANDFRADLAAFNANKTPGFVNFEGWIAGKVWIEAVNRTEGSLTVDALIDTLSDPSFSVDLAIGAPIAFPQGSHEGSMSVYGSILGTDCTYQDFTFED